MPEKQDPHQRESPGTPHSQNAARGNDSTQIMFLCLAPHRFNCRPGQTTDRSRSTSLTSCPTFLLISPHRTETLFSLFRALHTCGWGSRAKSSSYTRQSNPAPHSGPKDARVYLNEPRLSKPIFPRSASSSSYDVRAPCRGLSPMRSSLSFLRPMG